METRKLKLKRPGKTKEKERPERKKREARRSNSI